MKIGKTGASRATATGSVLRPWCFDEQGNAGNMKTLELKTHGITVIKTNKALWFSENATGCYFVLKGTKISGHWPSKLYLGRAVMKATVTFKLKGENPTGCATEISAHVEAGLESGGTILEAEESTTG